MTVRPSPSSVGLPSKTIGLVAAPAYFPLNWCNWARRIFWIFYNHDRVLGTSIPTSITVVETRYLSSGRNSSIIWFFHLLKPCHAKDQSSNPENTFCQFLKLGRMAHLLRGFNKGCNYVGLTSFSNLLPGESIYFHPGLFIFPNRYDWTPARW